MKLRAGPGASPQRGEMFIGLSPLQRSFLGELEGCLQFAEEAQRYAIMSINIRRLQRLRFANALIFSAAGIWFNYCLSNPQQQQR
ncbi:MAG TPA: hypothetical protein DC047_16660 [Blastocatellia bacterium]|nr:hypothetical protein [Blastocatellia bacterium]